MRGSMKSIVLFVCAVIVTGTVAAGKSSVDQKRQDIRKTAAQTLDRLYEIQPSAKSAINGAAGYAVFNNFGMKILIAGGGKGTGIVVDNSTGKETFMKMVEIQAGLGMGVKKFHVVFIFDNHSVLNQFIESGWELGAQATAAAKVSGQGGAYAGAMSVSPGVWLYQLTDEGLALELTAKGTKYYKDDALN